MYSRLLSRPSRRKAIPFERLRCRRQLVGHRSEPVPRGQPADRRNRGPGHGNDVQRAEPNGDKPAPTGRATQIAAMVITGLVAVIWVYFGRLYLVHDPDENRVTKSYAFWSWVLRGAFCTPTFLESLFARYFPLPAISYGFRLQLSINFFVRQPLPCGRIRGLSRNHHSG
jgi:hypothetical protein